MKLNSLALVIAEPFVEHRYPGGVQGFLGDQVTDQGADQRLIRSGQLVAVVDDDPERLVATYARIQQLTGQSINAGAPCVLVDPDEGLMAPCNWLTFVPLGNGRAEVQYTGNWCDDAGKGDDTSPCANAPVAPPTQLALHFGDEPTLVRLSEENGLITWLDTSTGRQLMSNVLPAPKADEDEDAPRPMIDAAVALLERRDWNFERDEDGDLEFTLNAGPLLLLRLRFIASDKGDTLIFAARLPGRVYEDRRASVAQYLIGANWLLEVGSFDMDLSDGEVIYRAGIVAPDGMLRPSAAEIALDRSMHSVTFYAAGLIEVARGADPREVLARVEGS